MVPLNPNSRKRLGQFFSGALVGRLLAALCEANKKTSIADPMVGTGDLLQSCLDVGAIPERIFGVEIDSVAAQVAQQIEGAEILTGSAFDPRVYFGCNGESFDLVIANPPYVRYQDLSVSREGQPSSEEVRSGLLQCLRTLGDLDDDERNHLVVAAQSYSGHADLAVPSVILCMALVARGGTMGLVLPQAWLSRNYSTGVRACLDKLFHVEVIAEDASATWFKDALVRTALIVARRRRGLCGRVAKPKHLRIHSSAADTASLVGALSTHSGHPELSFSRKVRSGAEFDPEKIELASRATVSTTSHSLRIEPFHGLPFEVPKFQSLEAYDVVVGQGLRTGANNFFYVSPVSASSFKSSASLGNAYIDCPPQAMKKAIRDQSGTAQAILDLRRFVLPEDAERAPHGDDRIVMDRSLAHYVRTAGSALGGKPGRQKPIKELSAVRTNARPARNGLPARHWYMLPDFQRRHMPDCYLPRLNSRRPNANSCDGETLVDANFITFACGGSLNGQGLKALLNSAWTWFWLENEGAVMGGGALKLEGTMLRRLPFPQLSSAQIRELNDIGARKSKNDLDPLVEIDVLSVDQNEMMVIAAERRLRARIKQ